jgi:hypothetical protein
MVSPIAILQTWGEWQLVFIIKISMFTLWSSMIAGDAGEYVAFMSLYASFKLTNIVYDVTVNVKDNTSRFTFDQAVSSSLLLCFSAVTGYLVVARCHRQMRFSFLLNHLNSTAASSIDSSKKDSNSLPQDGSLGDSSPIIPKKDRLKHAHSAGVSPLNAVANNKRRAGVSPLISVVRESRSAGISPLNAISKDTRKSRILELGTDFQEGHNRHVPSPPVTSERIMNRRKRTEGQEDGARMHER